MVFVETSFPRGGTAKPDDASAVAAASGSAVPDIEFGATTFKRKKEKLNKRQREEKHIRDNEERQDKVEAVSAELLSLKTISEGMLVMGSISKIDATHVQVSLPGRLTGRVLVTAMGPAYVDCVNKYVNDVANVLGYKTLDELFSIGQIVCVKVMQIRAGEDQPRALIDLSMNPADLQADYQHKRVGVDAVLCAAVSDIEDHGYVLNAGISNLRVFLPLDEAGGRDLGVGEIIFVRVQSAKKAAAASTVVCTLINELAGRTPSAAISGKDSANLTYVLPTSVVKFKVTKCLRDGLQGTVLNGTYTAYVNEHQLQRPLSAPEDYKVDAELDARILYVMPLTKLVYVSLNLSETIARTDSELSVGTIIEQARVTRIGTGGLIVRLDKRHKGLVSFRSLRVGQYGGNFDTDDLLAKYHKNSVHRVRITGFDPMDSLYVCTTNEKLLAEKYFTVDDVEVGDFVDATLVHTLADGAWFAKVGQVKAYLERLQISGSTPASKLQDGGRLRCRVLRKHAKDAKLFLTNRKEFLSEETLLLRSCEKAVIGLDYHGMIVKIFADGYLVSFCQYVKGMLYKRNLSEEDAAAAAYYRVGQILKFRVQFVRGDGFITLGLGAFVCQTGTVMAGKVATVDENGLSLAFPNAKLSGFAPAMLLTDFAALRPLMHQTYRANEPVEAVCVAQNVYSVRDVRRVRVQPVRRWSDVRVGDVLPAYVRDVRGDVVDLMCLIEQYAKVVHCHVKMLLEDHTRETRIDLVPEQLVYVRVLGKNDMLKQLTVSARLSHVWTGDLRETAQQFRQYFVDLARVRRYCEKIENALATVEPGMVYRGRVTAVDAEQATVRLMHGVTGIISLANPAERRPQVDETIQCMAVWVDYVENVVYVTAVPHYVKRVAETTEPISQKRVAEARGLKADVLLVRDTFAVLLPRKCWQKFVYVPTRLHHNDLQPVVMNGVRIGDVVNVTALEVDDEWTIGMFEHIHSMFGKFRVQRAKNLQLKRLAKLVGENVKDEEEDKVKVEEVDADAEDAPLLFSGDVVKTEAAEEDDDDDVADDSVTDQDLFFEDTFGSLAGAAPQTPNATKQAEKRKSQTPVQTILKKPKQKPAIKIEQLDGATGAAVSDDDSDDDEFDAKAAARLVQQKQNTATGSGKRKFEKRSKAPAGKLPGASNFWSTDLAALHKARKYQQAAAAVESSDDDDNANNASGSAGPAKKPKISTADRFRLARTEEARVRTIEESYANADAQPTTVDHFERLVMATPNASLAWINYMVFHMQCNEIHRARLVARKAFKKISFRDGEELLNVWVALLNLELRYGDKETFDAVLAEALLVNEPFNIYTRCLQMLVSVAKVEELTDMVLTFTKKFRGNAECWTSAAAALFEVGLVDKAQSLLNRALTSLPERDRKFGWRGTFVIDGILTLYVFYSIFLHRC